MNKNTLNLDTLRFGVSATALLWVISIIVWGTRRASSFSTSVELKIDSLVAEIERNQEYIDTDRIITNEINISLAVIKQQVSIIAESIKKNDQ